MSKVLVALSGGVDSAVAALLLKREGHDVHAAYMRTWMNEEGGKFFGECPWEDDVANARAVAEKLDIPFKLVDLIADYREHIVSYLVEGYRSGLTPNPDMLCNREMKFGVFARKAFADGFDYVATGHYARRRDNADGTADILCGNDPNKDQTYFLALLRQEQAKRALFPVGHLQKPELRQLAEEAGLPNAKRKDSQGICFLGNINYNEFIRNYLGEREGDIIELETGKKLGKHKGYWFHTIGQRKGLGLSGGPWFVIRKDIKHNRLYVSNGFDPDTQYGTELNLTGFRFITGNPLGDLAEPTRITFKNRHTPEFTGGTLQRTGEDKVRIVSDERIQGIAPGQFGVIYSADRRLCLASGVIE